MKTSFIKLCKMTRIPLLNHLSEAFKKCLNHKLKKSKCVIQYINKIEIKSLWSKTNKIWID